MFGSSFSGVEWIGFHLHWISCVLFFFGLVATVIWFARFATKQQLKKMVWTGLLLGGIGMILTAGLAFNGMREMMDGEWDEDSDEVSEPEEEEDFDDMKDFMEYMMDYEDSEDSDEVAPVESTTDTSTVQ